MKTPGQSLLLWKRVYSSLAAASLCEVPLSHLRRNRQVIEFTALRSADGIAVGIRNIQIRRGTRGILGHDELAATHVGYATRIPASEIAIAKSC